ncbi:hypothetical protein [Streptomyces chumphonensis]|uniref:hypothetical protein n=1 Tax=Streptomyces chumphonensis TaxID=1214925 RepID=UPI003D7479F3
MRDDQNPPIFPAHPVARPTPADDAPVPAPRWAVVAAHLVPLTVLPSGVWRVAMALGVPVGYSDAVLRSQYDAPGRGSVTIIGISVVAEVLALLTLGLVRPWGERVPGRVPFIGGRRIPPWAVLVPAALGALVLTSVLTGQALLWNSVGHGAISAEGRAVLGWCYLPLLAWGPLLAAVTVSYHRRRRSGR